MSVKVKSTTLTPGRWIYVCPCGFRYTVCRVDKKDNRWMIYCFKCKQSNGKYYKVMDERLEFEDNFNKIVNMCLATDSQEAETGLRRAETLLILNEE